MKKPLFEYLNSPFALLVAGFLLTTLVGSYINHVFHAESWKSEARFEIFIERFNEAIETQSSILVLSNERIILLERIYFELEENRLRSAREIWKEYFQIVKEWNNNVKNNNNRISLLFGESTSLSFLDSKEKTADQPTSLHHIFRKAHNSVLEMIECMKYGCDLTRQEALLLEARGRLDLLGLAHDNFATQLRTVLRQKEAKLLE